MRTNDPQRGGGDSPCPIGEPRPAPVPGTSDPDLEPRNSAYTAYASVDTVLSLQHPRTNAPTEHGFLILTQVKELLFKLLHTELNTARDYLMADRLDDVLWTLRRANRVQQMLLSCWEWFSALAPGEFASFRDVLGPASGFQSFSYRRLEFLLGNKNPQLAKLHQRTPQYAEVLAALNEPSLYDEVLRYMARRGHAVPPTLLERDFSVPYEPDAKVAEAWRLVYEQPGEDHGMFLLGEALVDTASLFARWRYTHLLTVQRVLGDKRGTGGTDGAPWLSRIAEHRFFPELWSMRSTM
ncbi:tryptophan 2,3-dioxygenase [Wenjunlia vitaminophila]|uniref:Tryptophan 2,3-dioxygenase n=1 Tax=Wenjunlia vitaminophila TaxID=76728 RepID=A0A0T6LQ43_WENVI|nr:tryptophan 2,3-dioxygenase family protein [Wenjunlia vitaminophila]KRV48160.1 tryptophan 2,3-dioxygenase [Wenjunlia vitaminophila]